MRKGCGTREKRKRNDTKNKQHARLKAAATKKGLRELRSPFDFNPGGDLLSHTVTSAVPSALEDFTSVFGMETGVPPPA